MHDINKNISDTHLPSMVEHIGIEQVLKYCQKCSNISYPFLFSCIVQDFV